MSGVDVKPYLTLHLGYSLRGPIKVTMSVTQRKTYASKIYERRPEVQETIKSLSDSNILSW